MVDPGDDGGRHHRRIRLDGGGVAIAGLSSEEEPGAGGGRALPRPRWPVVLFDLDGTVLDTLELIVGGYQHAARAVLGRQWDEAAVKSWIGQPLMGTLRRMDPDQADQLHEAYQAYHQAHAERLTRPCPGMPELLGDLAAAGVRTGAVTSKRRRSATAGLALTGLADRLPLLVAYEDVAEHKPSPAPIAAALARLAASPADAAYVGDAVVDIEAARRAGVAGVAVAWGAGDPAAIQAAAPDWLAATVADLRSLLLPA